ncbi:MAG: hypothetical protein R2699_01810 [Acidimicrobiales bacterium]
MRAYVDDVYYVGVPTQANGTYTIAGLDPAGRLRPALHRRLGQSPAAVVENCISPRWRRR